MLLNVLRWVAVFPAYLACAIFGTMLARLISCQIRAELVLTGFMAGFIAVGISGLVAPSHKTFTVIVLAVFNGLWALAYGRRLASVWDLRVDYLFAGCALGGIACAFALSRVWY
jgi:hypothetical protein